MRLACVFLLRLCTIAAEGSILSQPLAESSLCGGSPLATLPAKPPLKGEVPAIGGRREPFGDASRKASPERGGARHRRAEGFVSRAARPRRLCQPPWTQPSLLGARPLLRRNQLRKKGAPQAPAALREGARGRGFSQRSRLPRKLPQLNLWKFEIYCGRIGSFKRKVCFSAD